MKKRIAVAGVFLPFFYLIISAHSPVVFSIFVFLISFLGLWEYYRLYFREGNLPVLLAGETIAFLILLGFLEKIVENGPLLSGYFLPIVGSAGLLYLSVHLLVQRASYFLSVNVLGFGLFYVPFFLGHLILLRGMENGAQLVFFLCFVTWGTDAGAYFAGKAFGKRKMAPLISPNKTWEGAAGGLLAGIAFSVLSWYWFLPFMTLKEAVSLALALGIAGQAGDLVESMFKRSNQVKDSGSWIPGHGGVLDKVDSFIFTGPLLYYCVRYFPAGQ
ncbi:MAG TPA: phosphatidate cytidylyltransferase [Nitrospiria bacterium]|nr:phosphatidate cytidylyltransferase [Nitrospiria bacterium]